MAIMIVILMMILVIVIALGFGMVMELNLDLEILILVAIVVIMIMVKVISVLIAQQSIARHSISTVVARVQEQSDQEAYDEDMKDGLSTYVPQYVDYTKQYDNT